MNKRQMSLAASFASQPFSISSARDAETSRASIAIAKGQDTQELDQRKTSATKPVLAASNRNRSFSPALKRYDSTTTGSGKASTSKDVVSSIIPQNAQQYDYMRADSNAARNNAKLLKRFLGGRKSNANGRYLSTPATDCAPLPLQPVNDADRLLSQAEEFLPTFAHMLARCAPSWDEQTKAQVLEELAAAGVKLRGPVYADTKSPESMERKAKEHGRADMISDVLRGVVLITSVDELHEVYDKIRSTFKVVSEDDRFNNPTGTGRFGYNGIVLLPNKMLAEIRIATPTAYAWHAGQGRKAFDKLCAMKPKNEQAWLQYMKTLTQCTIGWNNCLRGGETGNVSSRDDAKPATENTGIPGNDSETPGFPVKQSIGKRIGKSLVRAYDTVIKSLVRDGKEETTDLGDGRVQVRKYMGTVDHKSRAKRYDAAGMLGVAATSARNAGKPHYMFGSHAGFKVHREKQPVDHQFEVHPDGSVYEHFTRYPGDVRKSFKLDGRREFQGLKISIENRRGSMRRGVGPDGESWATKMFHQYGYILGTEGKDGDHLDCFIGPNDNAAMAYVIHQKNDAGGFDEDKVMLGFDSEVHARDAYLAHYDTHKYLGEITAMPMTEFIEKVKSGKYAGKMLKSVAGDDINKGTFTEEQVRERGRKALEQDMKENGPIKNAGDFKRRLKKLLSRTYGKPDKPAEKEFDSVDDELEYDLKDEKKATKDYKELVDKVKRPRDKKRLEEMSDDEHKHAGYIQDMLSKALGGPRMVLDIMKSQVKGHWRMVDGKRVWVKPYSNKRSRKPDDLADTHARMVESGESLQRELDEVAPAERDPAAQDILDATRSARNEYLLNLSTERENQERRCALETKAADRLSSVRLKADPKLVWGLMKSDAPSNLKAFVAVRECLQNSADAIYRRIAKGEIDRGKFTITYNKNTGTMVIEDNGGGMDISTLQEKFLTMGGSGKSEETDGDSIGGFGVAKSYILGVVDWDKPGAGVVMRSRDYTINTADPLTDDGGMAVHYGQENMAGFRLEFTGIDERAWGWSEFQDQMKRMLKYSDFGDKIDIVINGETKEVGDGVVRARKLEVSANMPEGIAVKAFMPRKDKRDADGESSYVFVRIRSPKYGYSLYHTGSWVSNSATAKHDMLLDVACKIRPRNPDYPFNLARLEMKGALKDTIQELSQRLSVDEDAMMLQHDYQTDYYTNGYVSGYNAIPKTWKEAEEAIAASPELQEIADTVNTLRRDMVVGTPPPDAMVASSGGASARSELADENTGVAQSPIGVPFIVSKMRGSKSGKGFKLTAARLKELLAWEVAGRMICRELVRNGILSEHSASSWSPGIILNDDLEGLHASGVFTPNGVQDGSGGSNTFIMMNPYYVTPRLDRMRTPEAKAEVLAALAAHEVAHFFVSEHNSEFSRINTDINMLMPAVSQDIRDMCGAILSGKTPKAKEVKRQPDVWSKDARDEWTAHVGYTSQDRQKAAAHPDYGSGVEIGRSFFMRLVWNLVKHIREGKISTDDATQTMFTKVQRRAWQCKLDYDKRASMGYSDDNWRQQNLLGERAELQQIIKDWASYTGAKNERRKVPGVRSLKLSLAATFGGEDGD